MLYNYSQNIKKKIGGAMATIEKRKELGCVEFFSLSMVAVSDNLYDCIFTEIEKQYGKMIGKITEKMIREKMHATTEFGEVVFIRRKKGLSVSVAIDDVSFPPTYDYGIVSVCLLLPLYGRSGILKGLVREIAKEIGLNDVSDDQNGSGLEVKILLRGENMPYQVIPNPHYAPNGRAQRCFITRGELSACSPIR